MYKKKYICISFLLFFMLNTTIGFAQSNFETISLANFNLQNSITINLPIREASGIAYDKRSNLFYIHEDSNNSNKVLVTDTNGKIKHYITLTELKNNDWEDITSNNNGKLWIVDSGKALYSFKVDIKGELINDSIEIFALPDLLIGKNIESIDYIPEDNSFIAIFKGKGNEIYKFKAGEKKAKLIGKIPETLKIKPSGLTHNKISGNFFVLAFIGKKIVEFDPSFKKILNVINLPENNFYTFQAEGIDFDGDNNLVIVIEKPWYSLTGHSKLIKLLYKKQETINVK